MEKVLNYPTKTEQEIVIKAPEEFKKRLMIYYQSWS